MSLNGGRDVAGEMFGGKGGGGGGLVVGSRP